MKTYKLWSLASARAAPLPLMPTATPHTKLHMPTVMPDQKMANPVKYASGDESAIPVAALSLDEKMMAMMTP